MWFCLLLGAPYEAAEDLLDSTDSIEKGWLIVDAQYFSRVQRSPRGYQLLPGKRTLLVNSLIRLPKPVEFEPRLSRTGSDNPLRVMLDPAYNTIESSIQSL